MGKKLPMWALGLVFGPLLILTPLLVSAAIIVIFEYRKRSFVVSPMRSRPLTFAAVQMPPVGDFECKSKRRVFILGKYSCKVTPLLICTSFKFNAFLIHTIIPPQLYQILPLAKWWSYSPVYHHPNKKILAFLVIMLLSEIAAMVVLFEVPKAGLVGTNNPSYDLFICADGDPPHVHWMAYVPVITLTTESILLGLAVFKASQQFHAGISGGRILPKLTRESVFFFSSIFGIHLGNLIIWMINTLTVNELITGYSFAIPAVLANRLLISVREQVDFTETVISNNPIRFRRPDTVTTEDTTVANTFELTAIREEHNYEGQTKIRGTVERKNRIFRSLFFGDFQLPLHFLTECQEEVSGTATRIVCKATTRKLGLPSVHVIKGPNSLIRKSNLLHVGDFAPPRSDPTAIRWLRP
ncbi:hypothetical protein DFH07DRAFT_784768 [Mycena maculata]|uniref:Uncharacterized protein n=1 Tax=Mycena maculata TaxID=230809 RepID=A0AAD7HF97_9AGAR|nr:hypothetical protein DFH07DRAFT_784768 [Mycena maculata]